MQGQKTGPDFDPLYQDRIVRHFLNFFKSKKKQAQVRPGALTPDDLKKRVNEIGKGKKVNIQRVQYDGTPEEQPIIVKLLAIRDEYFTGEFVNVERSIKQEMDDKLIYVKGGGGSIDFYYTDGDIMSIEEDFDETIIHQMNEDEVLEILDALDLNESIRISYYDKSKGGVMNGTGKLLEKDVSNKSFKVELNLVNDIELDHVKTVSLNLDQIPVFDLEVVI
jgi:hypothetical protein